MDRYETDLGLHSQIKVWNLDKRDGGNPLCTRIFPAIPGNKPTEVSCLGVHENLNFMAIGKKRKEKKESAFRPSNHYLTNTELC